MGQTLATWRVRTRELAGNPSTNDIGDSAVESHVKAAIRRFSKDSPQLKFTDYAGNGSTYDLSLPPGWVNRFSSIGAVEYPLGERPQVLLDMAEVSLYPSTSTPTFIRLAYTTPAAGQTARVYWTAPWPMPDNNAATDLISDQDYEAVAHLAAALCALQLAGDAADHTRSTLPGAEFAGTNEEQSKWLEIFRNNRRFYVDHVGSSDGPPPASGQTDWDARSSWIANGGQFLFKQRRR